MQQTWKPLFGPSDYGVSNEAMSNPHWEDILRQEYESSQYNDVFEQKAYQNGNNGNNSYNHNNGNVNNYNSNNGGNHNVLDLTKSDDDIRKPYNQQIQFNCLDAIIPTLGPIDPRVVQVLMEPLKFEGKLKSPYLQDLDPQCLPKIRYLQQKNPHPLDGKLIAPSDPHVYYFSGLCSNIISSTKFVHAFFPHFDAKKQAAKTANGKTFLTSFHRPSSLYYGCQPTAESVEERWNLWRDLGTMLHDNIESFLNGEPLESIVIHPDNHNLFYNQFLPFYQNKDVWTWETYRTEFPIFDEETRVAGKLDCICLTKQGKIIILDWKRAKDISDCSFTKLMGQGAEYGMYPCNQTENCKMATYGLQQNVYKYILEKNYGFCVEAMFLLQMHPTLKRAVLITVPNMQNLVKKMFAVVKCLRMQQQQQQQQ